MKTFKSHNYFTKTVIKTIKMKYYLVFLLVFISSCKDISIDKVSQTPSTIELPENKSSIVFIAGFDEDNNTYYENAKKHFKAQGLEVIDTYFSLTEIINFLNQNDTKNYKEIHIVCHSNPWLGMSLKTIQDGERITSESLSKAKDLGEIPTLKKGISNSSKVIFHSCGLGQNKALLSALQQVFTVDENPTVMASPFFNVFGGKYSGHYLAKSYYGYYPTAESPGPLALSKDFQTSYPNKEIDWLTALKTRKETTIGEVYSYKFNIPVEWEFTFDDETMIPELKNRDDIMDWVSESEELATVLYNLNIPIEKYRWRSNVKGKTLKIKGKTTVLCVLEPLLDNNDAMEYKNISFSDSSMYEIL